jgi:hypothetical protein
MELKGCGKAVVAARSAGASRLLHKDPLDLAAPLGDSFLGT